MVLSRLSRYVFREILFSTLLGAVLATFVIFLQRLGKLFELLVGNSARPEVVLQLFALAVPPLLPLTIPFGLLVGILIGLGRLSSDGEITAMRAAGVPARRAALPVMVLALGATAVAAVCSLTLYPWSTRETYRIANQLLAAQLTAEIQPRVFEEQFPNTILYVGDVRPGNVALWRNVFMADITPPEQRSSGLQQKAEGPLVTVARQAIAVPDPPNNRIQLHLVDASTHEVDKAAEAYDTSFAEGDVALTAAPPAARQAPRFREMDTGQLRRHAAGGDVEARIELHRRFALPVACLVLALVGFPLGVSSRRGGKSAGYVTAIFLAFFCYHLSFLSLIGLAKQGALPVEVAAWAPNAAFAIAGLLLLLRLETPGERDWVGMLRGLLERAHLGVKRRLSPASPGRRAPVLGLGAQIIDSYLLSTFLFYLGILLATFVVMAQVYNFFELLSDVVKNQIPMAKVFAYLFFLTPKLVYDFMPLSVLAAVLVTLGILSKQNEVTAFKACGVSLHRLAAPVFLAGSALSLALFLFDHYWVPGANRRQDALRNEIKGRPVQTYLDPGRKFIFGRGSRIYHYRHFEQSQSVMVGVHVFELDPQTFALRRQIAAERAQWQPQLGTWIFQNGWRRDIGRPGPFELFQVKTFAELDEPPGYFLKEVKQ
ncbi:MAG: YjgP/YjgQ family permease, partial [Acidobacteria bacterium]|nr:YjgP/YjgQ family permease [Acidobacteriota bacterium]